MYEETPKDVFDLCYNDILKWTDDLEKLSSQLNIPISYYEDLFNPSGDGRLRIGDKENLIKKLI